MSRHTSGPWRVAGFDEERVYFEVRSNGFPYENLPAVALAAGRDKTEAEANARLIAAAPDLLRELRHLVESYEASYRLAGGTSTLPELENANIAIRKAEG